jgi:DNA-binding CsgD family transcriptional regulator
VVPHVAIIHVGGMTLAFRSDEFSEEIEGSAVDRAQLHLAVAMVSYMSGSVGRSRAEAEAVLAEPGLPAALYAAAEQSRLLALLAHGDAPTAGDDAAPAALLSRAALAWRAGRIDETLDMLSAATRADTGSRHQHCYPGLGLATAYTALGKFDEARTCVRSAADSIALAGDPLWTAAPSVFSARIELAAGRLDEAWAAAAAGVATAGELRTTVFASIGYDVLVTVAMVRGELEEATRQHRRRSSGSVATGLPFGTPNPQWSALRLREAQGGAILGDGPGANAFDVVATDLALLVEEPAAAAWLIRAARRAGDARRADDVLTTMDGLAAANPGYPTVAAAAAHARGIATSDPERLAVAATEHRSPWARASAAEDSAEVRASHGDRAEARSWLERAAEDYLRCGAARDHARICSRLRDLGVRRRHWSRQQRPVSGWDSLTETEHAVAELVAEGLSNQHVAARMFLSRHTVDFHLRHIFRKLGIDSRVVLTRLALEHAERAS